MQVKGVEGKISAHVSKMVQGDGHGLMCDEGHLGYTKDVSNKTFKLMESKTMSIYYCIFFFMLGCTCEHY